MGGKKKFEEKIYYKKQIINGVVTNGVDTTIVTVPKSPSKIFTTKETDHKYLVEKSDTCVSEISYVTNKNPSSSDSSIWNYEIRFSEPKTNSYLSLIGTFATIENIKKTGVYYPTIVAASGRFKDATKAIGYYEYTENTQGNIINNFFKVTVTGYR
jgi:hypothetical protein